MISPIGFSCDVGMVALSNQTGTRPPKSRFTIERTAASLWAWAVLRGSTLNRSDDRGIGAMSDINSSRRNRVSEKALKATIRAMTETGLTISKVVIHGSQIEIHCGDQVASKDEFDLMSEDRANGLEPW